MKTNISGGMKSFHEMYAKTRFLTETIENDFYTINKLGENFSPDKYAHIHPETTSFPYDHLNASSDGLQSNGTIVTVLSSYPSGVLWFGAICSILLSVFGTTGNFITVLALFRCKKLRNATTAFIINLAIADMLHCCFTFPHTAVIFIERTWRYGDFLCKLFALNKFCNANVSIYTVVAIAINRYILIVHPKIYPTLYTKTNTVICIASLWLIPLFVFSLPLLNLWGTVNFNPKNADCASQDMNGKSPRILLFSMFIIIPSIFCVVCYTKIYFVVKKSVRHFPKKDEYPMNEADKRITIPALDAAKNDGFQRSSIRIEMGNKKEIRVLRIILFILIFYIVSVLPVCMIKLFRREANLPMLNMLFYMFYFSSSVVNPVIYVFLSKEYRIAYKELFKMCCK